MLRREWKDLQTEDWKPGLKQAGRWRKEMQGTRPNHPACIIFTVLFCHTFLVKYVNQKSWISALWLGLRVLWCICTRQRMTMPQSILLYLQKVNTALRHFNTSAFWRLLSFATRSVFWKSVIQIAKTLCQKRHKSKYSFLKPLCTKYPAYLPQFWCRNNCLPKQIPPHFSKTNGHKT